MTTDFDQLVRENLSFIHSEMKGQTALVDHYGADSLSFEEEMEQLREYIHDAGEYGLAYECIVVAAEEVPFVLTSQAAVKLLEVGLIMGFKTERPKDAAFHAGQQHLGRCVPHPPALNDDDK